ncbi:hypothetical protein [Cellulomonas endophytica]|uniref:hypothetical protein n=1 Tax=Cellulomonas endophytica TaxID=2494735 RepID=UPI001013839C|nr:hypothetical protein [Cellulomonas endophytica]
MLPTDWTEHRRAGDRELLGWVRPVGEGWVAVDRLGRDLTGVVDWMEAEEALEAHGIAWLSGLWQLPATDGSRLRVRVVEVRADAVVVATDDLGSVDAPQVRHVLPFPAPKDLVPFAGDAHTLDAGLFGRH